MICIYNIHICDKPEKCNALGMCACIVYVYVMRNVHSHLFWSSLHLYFCPLFSLLLFLKTGSLNILQADLQLVILLLHLPLFLRLQKSPTHAGFPISLMPCSVIIHDSSYPLPILFLPYCSSSSHQLKGGRTCVFLHSLFTISFWFLYLLAKNVHLCFPLRSRFPSLFVSVALGRLPMHQWMAPHSRTCA